jgi:UDP-N-acetylmuramate dehydrogenase
MTFDPVIVYNEIHPYFQKRVHRHEPQARHAAFGVGGPADVWVSLASKEELLALVRLCAQEHWPLLVVGNGTNVLFADVGVRGIVARVALGAYHIEERTMAAP